MSAETIMTDAQPSRILGAATLEECEAHEAAKAPPGDAGVLLAAVHKAKTLDPHYPPGCPWADPQALVTKIEREVYPLEVLPRTIREAVEEVSEYSKAPIEMIASCALGALSVAVQGHLDVARDRTLRGPSSLFMITVAESGERKTTCDGYFASPIRAFDAECAKANEQTVRTYKTQFDSWAAVREGLLAKIKHETRAAKVSTTTPAQDDAIEQKAPIDFSPDCLRPKTTKDALIAHDEKMPAAPRVPLFLRGDDTPENLGWSLAQEWPSGGVLSSEAGVVLGSHGMTGDSKMRNLALLNMLWDGGEHRVGRRTIDSYTVRNARLTLALQVQETALREFMSAKLARDTGFLARFLITWPKSTQGMREYTPSPEQSPFLTRFHERLDQVIRRLPELDELGGLRRRLMGIESATAKSVWVEYYNRIERQLKPGGNYADVRDVASKTADNAARIAAVLTAFSRGIEASIDEELMASACTLAEWHLNESRRLLGEIALPVVDADVLRLDKWLIGYCDAHDVQSISTTDTLQCGPYALRNKSALGRAIADLTALHRARIVLDGKMKRIQVHPALLARGQN